MWRWRGGAARRALRQRTLQSDCSHKKTRPFGILESSCGRCGLVESPQPPERNTKHSPHSIPTPSSRLFDGVLVCGVHPPALSHAPLVQLASTQVVLRVGGWKNISSFGPRRAPPSGSGSAEERDRQRIGRRRNLLSCSGCSGRSSRSLPLRALPDTELSCKLIKLSLASAHQQGARYEAGQRVGE